MVTKTSYRSMVLLAGLLLVLSCPALLAQTSGQDLGSDDDTFINANATGQPGGSTPNTPKEVALKVENDGLVGHPELRALIHFDLSQFTGLGVGSSVTSAILKLKYSDNSGAALGAPGTHLRIYRVTTAWSAGDGVAADNVGASWDQAKNGALHWTTNGGDFTPALGSGLLCTPATAAVVPATNNEVDFDITTFVNAWVNGGSPNDGLIVIDDLESSQNDYYHFFDGVDYATGTAANGPNLNVTYTSVTANTLNATQDLSISAAINNIGADHQIRLDGTADERMLLKFAIGAIPVAENVQSAVLRIKSAGTDFGSGESGGQAGTDSVTVYKLTQPAWTEGTGTRAAQATNGARWDKYDTTNAWTTAGGDFDATRAFVSPSTTIAGNDVDVTIDIDVTAIVSEQHIAAAASADFLVKPGALCDWRMGSKEYAGGLPPAPRTAQLIVTSNNAPGPAITVPTPANTSDATSQTITWTYTGALSTFNVYLVDSSLTAKKINVAPVAGAVGAGTFTWTINLAGLTAAPGTYTVKVVEATKLFQGVSAGFTINTAPTPISITTTSPITSGQELVVYGGVTFAASGGTGPYTWTATNKPAGLVLSAGGVLSGTPAAASSGTYVMVVTATDTLAATINKNITIVIAPAPGALALGFATIPAPKNGVAYSFTATATGGTGTYTWSATGLPTGLTIASATGIISGTTTDAVGSVSSVTITVNDGVTSKSSPVLTVTIASAAAGTGKKGGCEVGGSSSDWTAILFLLALAGAGMVVTRYTRKDAIA